MRADGAAGLSQPASRPVRTRLARAAVANDDPPASKDGILPGIAQWPPTPITEHGQPNPEDDPNPDANSGGGKTLYVLPLAGCSIAQLVSHMSLFTTGCGKCLNVWSHHKQKQS